MKHKNLLSTLLLALGLLGIGCSDPLLEEPVSAHTPPPAPPLITLIEPAMAPVLPPPGTTVAEMTPATPSNPLPEAVATEQTLHTVNMFLLEYQANGGRIPATVEELVMQKIVPKLPPPPAGKRFEVDPQKAMISFADI